MTTTNYFSAICETCGLVTLMSPHFDAVRELVNVHTAHRPSHVLLYRTHVVEVEEEEEVRLPILNVKAARE